MIDDVFKYSKIPVTIYYYAKSQSYAKATGDSSGQKDTRRAQSCTAAAVTSTSPEGVTGLKTNPDGTFKIYGKSYPLKAFVPEEIYLGCIPKPFFNVRRE